VALAGAACAGHGRPVLIVEDVTHRRVLHRGPVTPGDSLVLSYVHSSEHVPVRGTFVVEADGALRVEETAFAGFGPGLPEPAVGDAWRAENGMIVVSGAGARFPELRLRVGPLTRHRLRTPSGDDLDLSTLLGAGGSARISVTPQPR
jgi:hypothetical protein